MRITWHWRIFSLLSHFCSLEKKAETQLPSYLLSDQLRYNLVYGIQTAQSEFIHTTKAAHPILAIPEGKRSGRKRALGALVTCSHPCPAKLQLGIDKGTFFLWISSFNSSAAQWNNHSSKKSIKSLCLRLLEKKLIPLVWIGCDADCHFRLQKQVKTSPTQAFSSAYLLLPSWWQLSRSRQGFTEHLKEAEKRRQVLALTSPNLLVPLVFLGQSNPTSSYHHSTQEDI